MTFEPAHFQKALSQFANIISNKMALPILQDIIIGYDKGRDMVWLMASDSDSWLKMDCVSAVKNDDGTVEMKPWAKLLKNDTKEPFTSIGVRFKGAGDDRGLYHAISAVPRDGYLLQVEFSMVDGIGKMYVDYGLGDFTIPCDDAADFPVMQQVVTVEGVKSGEQSATSASPLCRLRLRSAQLLPAMKQARVCVANDELRPIMNGECMDVRIDGLTLVASDGHVLYKRMFPLAFGVTEIPEDGFGILESQQFGAAGSVKLVVPKSVFSTINDAFGNSDFVTVTADTLRTEWRSGGTVLVARSIEGSYPNYDSVIPKNNNHVLTMSVVAFNGALRRVGMFTNSSSYLIEGRREGDKFIIEANDYDFSCQGREQISLQSDTTLPDKMKFGFKKDKMIDLLGCISTENLHLLIDSPSTAFLLKEEDVKSSLTLLAMPMLINE